MLHLIPLIFGLHGHSHGKVEEGAEETGPPPISPDVVLKRGVMIMGGLYIFYLLETLLGMYQASGSPSKLCYRSRINSLRPTFCTKFLSMIP